MRDEIKLNSFAVELRRDWDMNPYSPIDLFSIVLSKIPELTIMFYPMSEFTSGMAVKETNGLGLNNIIIGINSNMSKGRQRFTLAHELYHLLYEEGGELIICERFNLTDSEKEADTFASYLLMPYGALERYVKTNNISEWDLDKVIALEQYFQLSHHAMLYRLHNQGFITEEQKEEFSKVYIGQEAKIRGYSDDLYTSTNKHRKYYALGNYIRLIKDANLSEKISKGKSDELLLDGFRGDLAYNGYKEYEEYDLDKE